MALFLCDIVQIGRKTVAQQWLLNTDKVVKFKTKSDGNTEFEYCDSEDRRDPIRKYTTELSRPAFEALVREADNEPYIWVNVLNDKIGRNINEMWKMAVKRIVKALDITTYHCDLWFEHGPFEIIKYRTSHTIDELNRAASQSISLSPSE